MSTLHELRATLDEHAETLHDDGRAVRAAAVHQRIRTARRRRAGTAAVAAAVVLSVAAGTAGLLRGSDAPEPAGPVVVPDRIEVAQFPYRLVEAVPAEPDGSLDLPATASDQVVVLAASGLGDGVATLLLGDEIAVARVAGDEQVSAPTAVIASELSVRLDDAPETARVEVAVYERTGQPAPGPASGSTAFRERIGDRELVAVAYGDAATPARIEVPGPADDVQVAVWCRTRTDLAVHLEPSSRAWTCAPWSADDVDPGATNAGYLRVPPATSTLTTYVTDGEDGPRVTSGGIELGIAAYRRTVPPTEVLGLGVPTVTEHDGRTWRLDEVVDPGEGREVDTRSGDVLLGVVVTGVSQLELSWRGAYDSSSAAASTGWSLAGVLWHGDRYEVDLAPAGTGAESRLVLYRPE